LKIDGFLAITAALTAKYSAYAPIPLVVPNTASSGAHAATSVPICLTIRNGRATCLAKRCWVVSEEVPNVAFFLASEESSYVTGVDIVVDDGMKVW
jgi:NAD(P)-dependent dehydrogenase (short-subunit alcohol dehydrogenase family)